MRKLLFILLLFPFVAKGQTATPIVMGSKYYEFKNALRPDSAFFLPRKDTSTTDVTLLAPGMLVYRTLDSLVYWRKGNKMTAFSPATGSNGYIWNGTTLQTPASYNISGTGNVQTTFTAGTRPAGNSALFVDSTTVTTNTNILLNNNSSFIRNAGNNFVIADDVIAGTTELAVINDAFNYGTSNYWGWHVITSISGDVHMQTIGRGSQRARTLLIGRSNDVGGTTNFVKIDTTGNVGIGTVSPTFKLDVSGTLRATGNTTFSANGTPALGRVPVGTDASGNWTWQDLLASVTASNGLTKVSNDIQLGGTLSSPTTITTGAANSLTITKTDASSNISRFALGGATGGSVYLMTQQIGTQRIGEVALTNSGTVFLRSNNNGQPGEDARLTVDGSGSTFIGSVTLSTDNTSGGAYKLVTRNNSTGRLETVTPPSPLGSVTSVGLSAPSVFSVSGSPVTSSGTLALSFATGQTANRFLATPDGSTGALSLRAISAADLGSGTANSGTFLRGNLTWGALAAADIPTGSGNYIQNQNASAQTANYWMNGYYIIGASAAERMSGRFNGIAFNRDITNGNIFSSSGHAYQIAHAASATAASDLLSFSVFNTGGTSVNSSALSINGLGFVGINTTAQNNPLEVRGSSSSTGSAMLVTNSTPSTLMRLDNNGEILIQNSVKIITGSGSPEGVKTAGPGSMYMRIDGVAGAALYVKESGTGNTGWMKVTTTAP